MSRLADVLHVTLHPLMLALPVMLAASVAYSEPITGASPGPAASLNAGPAVALPARVGSTAPLRKSYFSPVMGARFELVQMPIGGIHVSGAKLIARPIPGSPLEDMGLLPGDVITHLDGDAVVRTAELENHEDKTTVSWIAGNAQATRTSCSMGSRRTIGS